MTDISIGNRNAITSLKGKWIGNTLLPESQLPYDFGITGRQAMMGVRAAVIMRQWDTLLQDAWNFVVMLNPSRLDGGDGP
jgi:hypothetical protein